MQERQIPKPLPLPRKKLQRLPIRLSGWPAGLCILSPTSPEPSAPGLASFVPALLAHRFENGEGPRNASSESFPAAALFADISGFTALTERLAALGPAGVEELTRVLNAHFGRLIDTISNHGGDIIKFAGDALLAIWPSTEEGLADAAKTAAQCGLAAQAVFRDASAPESLRLSLRIAIGAGPISLLIVGGVNGRWEMVATGEVLRQ